MTIYDISRQAGVSIATVSRVLNGSPNVSTRTRQKVLDVIRRLGYTPNAFARGLGLNTMKTIGVLCADSSDLYLAKAIYHIERDLRSRGYGSILCCTGYSHEGRMDSIRLLLSKKVDGIILIGSNFVYDSDEENKYIADAAQQIPVMLLNASLNAPNVYSVLSDDRTSTYEAAKWLIAAGTKVPVYFYGSVSYSGKKKLSGFLAAMEESRLPFDDRQIQFFDGYHEDIPAMSRQLARLREEGFSFDGLIAADDTLALAAVKYAKEAGLGIPEDLSVIGYNNSMLVHCCDPELTSIDNRLESLCLHLTSTLMGVLEGREMPKQTVFSGELIRRGTTCGKE